MKKMLALDTPNLAEYTRLSTRNEAFQVVQATVEANIPLFAGLHEKGAKKKFFAELKRLWHLEPRSDTLIDVLMDEGGWNEDWRDTFRTGSKLCYLVT